MAINLMGRDLAIDLGTANTLVYMRGKGIILREPSVVALRNGTRREVVAVGDQARDMIGRTPGNIVAIRPLKEGVIADFDITEVMLKYFIRKAVPRTSSLLNPRVVLCVPCGITEVAVLSLGGIVTARSLRVGGNHMDDAIVDYIRREYNMMIGERTAEDLKIRIGSVYPVQEERSLQVRGRDLINGLPCTVSVNSREIRHALREPAAQIVAAVRQTLEQTPPELSGDIVQTGITLSGGTAALTGMQQLLQVETGMPVHVAPDPLDCVVLGASAVVDGLYGAGRATQKLRMESV